MLSLYKPYKKLIGSIQAPYRILELIGQQHRFQAEKRMAGLNPAILST
jgi:hypothetical protein